MKYVIEFCDHLYKGSDIPVIMSGLAAHAEISAQSIGDKKNEIRFRRDKATFQRQCPMAEIRTDEKYVLTPTAQEDGFYSQLDIIPGDSEQLLQNAVRKMVQWATSELSLGQPLESKAHMIFANALTLDSVMISPVVIEGSKSLGGNHEQSTGPERNAKIDPLSHPSSRDTASLEPCTIRMTEILFGKEGQPRNEDDWHLNFNAIERWLRDECQGSTEEARHYVLKNLQMSRCHNIRKALMKSGVTDALLEQLHLANKQYIRILDTTNVEAREAGNHAIEIKCIEMECIMNLCFSTTAWKEGRLSDDLLRLHMEDLGNKVCDYYRVTGLYEMLCAVLTQRARASHWTCCAFQTVEPVVSLGFLEEADRLYCELRREATIMAFQTGFKAKSFRGKHAVITRSTQSSIYEEALSISFYALRQALTMTTEDHGATRKVIQEKFQMCSKWIERSKSRILLEELGIEAQLPAWLLANSVLDKGDQDELDKENSLIFQISEAENPDQLAEQMDLRIQLRLHKELMRNKPSLRDVMSFRDGAPITEIEIQKMLSQLEPGTTFVTYIQVSNQPSSNLFIMIYRRNTAPEVFYTIRMETIQEWVAENLSLEDSDDEYEPFNTPEA